MTAGAPVIRSLSRRTFLGTGASAGAGLVLGIWMPGCEAESTGAGSASFEPGAWLAIDAGGRVTVRVSQCEIGQGVMTVLPMIVAEELGAAWDSVEMELANADRERYGDQTTGGSRSVRISWTPLRKAGASAREMLVAAAAGTWQVPPAECLASDGKVTHRGSGRALPFGDLVEKASALPVPEDPPLRDPTAFTLLGKPMLRVDGPAKAKGEAAFGMDLRVPGMLYAALARPPVLEGKLESFDASKAEAAEGVRRVLKIGDSVAVVAEGTWAAFKGRELLDVVWNPGPNASLDQAAIDAQWDAAAKGEAVRALEEGDVKAAFAVAEKTLDAVYEMPFLAHAPMEPQNCTASVTGDACEVWVPTQVPNEARSAAAQVSGLPMEKVTVHLTLSGGGFGRRLMVDYVAEAVFLSKSIGAPVKIVFSREEDMRRDFYRPGSRHVIRAGLDGDGRLMAWTHRVAAPSIGGQLGYVPVGTLDEGAVRGAANMPYAIPNVWVDYAMSNTPVPVGWLRSVYDQQTAFANECFIDEVAHAAGKDPVAMRRKLLEGSPRHLGVLELAAAKAGWGSPPPTGRHRGVAVHFCFQSYVASVVEISVRDDGTIRVHRVVSAIDCGLPLNPLGIQAQVEGGTVFGLTAALKGEITVEKGRIRQGNFDDYPLLRMDEMPVVEVHIVPSTESPTGTGEPPVPPMAPALANAVFAATGRRIRRLPLRL